MRRLFARSLHIKALLLCATVAGTLAATVPAPAHTEGWDRGGFGGAMNGASTSGASIVGASGASTNGGSIIAPAPSTELPGTRLLRDTPILRPATCTHHRPSSIHRPLR
jgi:hypothetical protein